MVLADPVRVPVTIGLRMKGFKLSNLGFYSAMTSNSIQRRMYRQVCYEIGLA